MGMRFSLDLYRNRYLANDFCVIHRVISFFFVGGNMENKKELLESIELLDERYKNAIYLVWESL